VRSNFTICIEPMSGARYARYFVTAVAYGVLAGVSGDAVD
jgi:hypothetical protein